jgi:hypothetical protein
MPGGRVATPKDFVNGRGRLAVRCRSVRSDTVDRSRLVVPAGVGAVRAWPRRVDACERLREDGLGPPSDDPAPRRQHLHRVQRAFSEHALGREVVPRREGVVPELDRVDRADAGDFRTDRDRVADLEPRTVEDSHAELMEELGARLERRAGDDQLRVTGRVEQPDRIDPAGPVGITGRIADTLENEALVGDHRRAAGKYLVEREAVAD